MPPGDISQVDRELSIALQALAGTLEKHLSAAAGEPIYFSLLLFRGEPGSRMQYVSNCDREYVVGAMKSLLEGWEAGMPDVPAHEIQG